jgi:hypothetical protein
MKFLLYLPTLVAICLISLCDLSANATVADTGSNPEAASISPSDNSDNEVATSPAEFQIPGPLRSFLRMAGISQEIAPADVLPLLAWNVSTLGYEGGNRQTEYLILLTRYFTQARELQALAGGAEVIRVSNCNDAAPLLQILGYRITSKCGQADTSLLTANAERAFLTIDSGFPLTELEQTLQGGKPFEYPFSGSPVPALFSENDWHSGGRKTHKDDTRDFVDMILSDRSAGRLYWALSKMDPETRAFLRRTLGIRRLLEYGAQLDFYGSHICVRRGRVLVPGGAEAESSWEDLAGASPGAPAEFIPALLSKDNGWLAAYFDVLSSVSGKQQTYFTKAHRLRRFYAGLHSSGQRPSATAGVFRPAPWLLLLVSQTQWSPNGEPLIPGGIEVWREVLPQWKDPSHTIRERDRRAVKNTDELLEAMFALSRDATNSGPLPAYLALGELDSRRPPGRALSPETVRTMCLKFGEFSDQYRIFTEFPELSDASILLFLDTAERLGKIHNPLRGDAFGIMQANIGIWQILARQGQIPSAQIDSSWQNVIKPFAGVRSSSQLYGAGRTSLAQLFRAATGNTAVTQDEMVDLLAGPRQTTPEGKKFHREIADRIRSVLDGQRLVSLDTLIALGDALEEKENGKSPAEFVLYAANELHEFQMPQPIFTNSERVEWAPALYNNRHTDLEMRTDVGGVLKSAKASHAQLEEARGQLTLFLRDILVGLNYAYYEPPGAQALHNNPLFVRSHDFSGETVEGIEAVWQAPQLFGAGYPAGGGAHFVGSLADLPYELAELEQDFIAPKHVQALIWQELVPSLLTSAVLSRWWNVSPAEMHAVTLYQRSGEELLTASAHDEQLRAKVIAILSDRVLPRRSEQIEQAMLDGPVSEVLAKVTPADTFYLSAEFEREYPGEAGSKTEASQELQNMRRQHPEEVSWKRLSQDFGVPHPALSHTYARELLNVPPLPAFSGFASRLLAESWDSSNLYWARLADETGYSPAALNRLIPQLTQQMVERIFATDLEDWPAILRALRETGEDFRNGKTASSMNIGDPRP